MQRGVLVALVGYVLWGLSPIFWRLGEGSAADILVFRVLSTAFLLAAIQLLRDRGAEVGARLRDPKVRRTAILSAALLASNWLVFIWAVNTDRVLQASLGYFLNPLVSVVLGVTVLSERLRRGQWFAIAIAAVGVVWLTDRPRHPAVGVAVPRGHVRAVRLVRKTAAVESLDGLSIEVWAMAPVALVALVVFTADDGGLATVSGVGGWVWVAGASLMTSIPLLLFAWAARRIALWAIGVLQYITPTLQFLLGVLAYDESWSGGQVVGYSIIWVGLAVFGAEGVRQARRLRSDHDLPRVAPDPAAAGER